MPKYLMLFSYITILLLISIFVYERELLLGRMEYDINTSFAMLSSGIACNMPRVTCIFRIHTSLPLGECVYEENASDKWHIPRYPTRKHCIITLSHA